MPAVTRVPCNSSSCWRLRLVLLFAHTGSFLAASTRTTTSTSVHMLSLFAVALCCWCPALLCARSFYVGLSCRRRCCAGWTTKITLTAGLHDAGRLIPKPLPFSACRCVAAIATRQPVVRLGLPRRQPFTKISFGLPVPAGNATPLTWWRRAAYACQALAFFSIASPQPSREPVLRQTPAAWRCAQFRFLVTVHALLTLALRVLPSRVRPHRA